ncbi:2-keto-4-pentenoate hydratase [Streptomyces profundus]|uniref:2-keto-4-pentenoate hydratase n=1 Tax=Streptomyces profundus TaxID=2867410 RepID=UPI001D16E1E4|nr:fumarylacetoacetate hydrolase family protein [Streptomyces sp. MA3_2.13]UED87895.1 4-oxalocrotonate decarboxylase [Streptomyces sp. MA3_2.13]
MSEWTIESTVDELLRRERERTDGGRITDRWPGLDLETAYRAQDALLARKQRAGERVVGVKLGLTSEAKQRRMGIDSPLTGWLTDAMVLPVGEPVRMDEMIHPRVEPEIVFTMGRRLAGPEVTVEQALDAVATVHAGFEVIDSRYRDFSFALPDVVADNASSCRFTVSAESFAPDGLDLVGEICQLSVDGDLVDTATGSAVQGHPAQALALAANDLARRGLAIEAGWTVLTGGLTDAVFVEPGRTISAAFTTLGSLALTGKR